MYVQTDEQYGKGVLLQEYKGTFSIVEARPRKDEDGYYFTWCTIEGRDGTEFRLPRGVTIGKSRKAAIETLQSLLAVLKQEEPDDVPF